MGNVGVSSSTRFCPNITVRRLRVFIVRITISICLGMGILSFFGCSKAGPKETAISQRGFSIALPGEWSRRSEEGGSRLVFSSSASREQLTVSLMPSSHRMEPEQRLSRFNRVLDLRRQSETQGLDPSAVTMTASTIMEESGIHSARYSGFEPSSQRRFTCLLCCSSSLVATFYYEAIGLPQSQAEERASAILASAKLIE